MDGVISPATAIEIGRLGGVGVLNLEGLWTRYDDPDSLFDGDRRAAAREGDAAHAGHLQRADQARADRRTHPPDQGRRRHLLRVGHPAAHRRLRPAHHRGRARPARHPGHRRVGRARVQDGRAAQPQAVRPRARHAGHRRRLRQLPGRPAPHAHRRRRHPRRRRTRPRLHDPRRARHRGAPGHGHRRRPRRAHAPPRRDRRLRARDRRRRHGHRWRHRQGHRVRRRCRDDRFAVGRGQRGARSRLPLGDGHVPSDAASRAPGSRPPRVAPSRRSSSARRTRTTAA